MPRLSDAALADLGHVLKTHGGAEPLQLWARTAEIDGIMLGSWCMGSIFWEKSLGVPETARLSDAFVVELSDIRLVQGGAPGSGGGPLIPLREPFFATVFDGQPDDTHYWVHFLRTGLKSGTFTLQVSLSPGVTWHRTWPELFGRVLDFRPRAQAIHKQDGVVANAAPTEVVAHQPVFLGR